MNHVERPRWHRWLTFSEVAFAFAFGIFLFVLLNIASAGVLVTLITAGACFALLGAAHYFVWGQDFSRDVAPARRRVEREQALAERVESADKFLLSLNDEERRDLIQVLNRSLQHDAMDPGTRAARQELLNKVRMFGA
ncbi:MAG TPA: hypothetical protein VFE62_25365 [Gemmataceae bacterium]|nr:hypothetical protein [Gemmataceae bacterium]